MTEFSLLSQLCLDPVGCHKPPPLPHTRTGHQAHTSPGDAATVIFFSCLASFRQTFNRPNVVNVFALRSDELCQGGVSRGPRPGLAGECCVVVTFGQLGMFKARRDELDMSH